MAMTVSASGNSEVEVPANATQEPRRRKPKSTPIAPMVNPTPATNCEKNGSHSVTVAMIPSTTAVNPNATDGPETGLRCG
jgi:hypothetical protein